MSTRIWPLVSVIVPVWNDASKLARCLHCLRAQSYPTSCLEIIVVDNASDDQSAEVAASLQNVTVLKEIVPGSYAARNAGLFYASGSYIAFTDSDCRPHRTWIEHGIQAALAVPDLGVLAGPVQIEKTGRTAAALYEEIFSFNQKLNVSQGTCTTANWLSPKSVLDRCGGFDSRLKSGGDLELSRRIKEAGYKIIFCDEMIVLHPPRANLSALLRKRRRVVGGKWLSSPKAAPLTLKITWDAVHRVIFALKHPKLKPHVRLLVVGVVVAVWVTGLFETMRLMFGFEPCR